VATTLATVAWLHETFSREGIAYWIFGGFAVDLHVGEETRAHDDVDVAVLGSDFERAAASLVAAGFSRDSNEADGYTTLERDGARIDLAPTWPSDAFGDDVCELGGVRARVVTRGSLIADKSEPRDDPTTAEKDAADLRRLQEH